MNDKLRIFNSERFGEIRIIIGNDGEPRFCLADVCRSLGLTQKGVAQRLDKGVISNYPLLTPGGQQNMNFVNEDGLYDTILESRKPEAKAFRKWVTSEVLPSIRKHGAYMTEQTLERALTDPKFLIRLATTLDEERTRRIAAEEQARQNSVQIAEMSSVIEEQAQEIVEKDATIDAQLVQIGKLERASAYVRTILKSNALITVTQIAQDYGISARKLNAKLRELRIQYRVNDQWILYAEHKDKGYAFSQTIIVGDNIPKMQTCWTQRGRLFLYHRLKAVGFLPTIERMAEEE